MGAAYFIVLEREIDGVQTSMNGKSLSRHMKALDEAARQLGVRPLSAFFSADPVEMAAFMEGEGIEAGGVALPPLRQFTAQDGLTTVRALATHPAAQADGVTRDLEECERILTVAAQHGVGWHFEVDF